VEKRLIENQGRELGKAMELTIDNPLQRHLNISVPSQQVENEVSNRLQRLARTVKMHGFRPGKVPVKMVEQQYGPSVRKEVLEDALKRSFREAVRDQNLRIAGVPRFDASPIPADGQSYEYSVTFEVYPEVARGIGGADIPLPDDLLDNQARRRVSLGLIMAELVKANDLHAKPEQVRAVVEDFAQSYEHPDEVVRWYYQSPERLGDAESLALESNVVEWMLGRCKVEDKPTAFDELMGNV
jgi:FKBP-type peptidyl-prolyl cis-trans isomerase (trigger factor)